MIFLSIVLIGLFYFDPAINENDVLEAPRTVEPLPNEDIVDESLDIDRPATGISTYIGESSDKWVERYGEPERIEPSAFGYDWWIYNASYAHFTMIGVKEGEDRKSTRLNSSHVKISYAVFCLQKKRTSDDGWHRAM